MPEVRLPSGLPEHFACLYNRDLGKFETPLDSRGIADVDAVFELAIWTYPGNIHKALREQRDKHHLYWTEKWWNEYADSQPTQKDRDTVRTFREGTPQKAYVPRSIHKWIETSQVPPPAPSIDTMRHRNFAWASAALLLKSCIELDKARSEYIDNKGRIRRILGAIEGITPVSKRLDEPFIDVVDDEYWLSELQDHLKKWRHIANTRGELPVSEGFIQLPRLVEVRKLRKYVRRGAFIPRLPDPLPTS